MKKILASLWFKLLMGFLGLVLLLSALTFTGISLYMGVVGYFEAPPKSFEESVEFDLVTDEMCIGNIYFNLDYSNRNADGSNVDYYDYRDYPAGFYYTLSAELNGETQVIYSSFETLPDREMLKGSRDIVCS